MKENDILLQFKKEYEDKKNKLENINKINRKIKIKKNIKKGITITRIALPFVTALCLSNPVLNLCKSNPFVKEDVKEYLVVEETIDSYGYFFIQKSYGSEVKDTNTLKYYSKWTKKDDIYYREIIEYDIEKLTLEYIKHILESKDTSTLPVKKEYTVSTNNPSLLDNERLECNYFTIDKENFVLRKEKNGENALDIFSFILYLLICALILIPAHDKFVNKLINYLRYDINNDSKYKLLNVEDLQVEYELALANYKRMVK